MIHLLKWAPGFGHIISRYHKIRARLASIDAARVCIRLIRYLKIYILTIVSVTMRPGLAIENKAIETLNHD